MSSPSPLHRTAERFEHFATAVYPGKSPLYATLAAKIAEDPELLELAAAAEEKDALPNLFLASVHLLLLNGSRHQLVAFYPSLNGTSRRYDYAYAHFRSFVLEHRDKIRKIIAMRRVQTNEAARCAVLLPGFEFLTRQASGRPLSLIEIGSSAGLTLIWDRYQYSYGEGLQCGDPNSLVRIECLLRGEIPPPLPRPLPRIASRIGIDLDPIDLNNPENVQWLRALVWPEQEKRAKQLEQAIQLAKQQPPHILAGNAIDLLPGLIDDTPRDALLCVYHSFTLTFAKREPRDDLISIMTKASRERKLFLVSMEWPADSESPRLDLVSFNDGIKDEKILARCDSHGEWLEWLDGSSC